MLNIPIEVKSGIFLVEVSGDLLRLAMLGHGIKELTDLVLGRWGREYSKPYPPSPPRLSPNSSRQASGEPAKHAARGQNTTRR